ncbi:MAG: undecaprenyl-phosphate glucose phosphotransferase [Flavobacteriales bacterium]|nr:undecaprenyl-phosphate glucose phosphotransferase [Flavobacteriales bacterium]
MKHRLSNYEKYAYGVLDALLLNITLLLSYIVVKGDVERILLNDHLYIFIFATCAWVAAVLSIDSKIDHRRLQTGKALWDFFYSFVLNVLLTLSFVAITDLEYSREFLLKGYGLFFIVGAFSRGLVRLYLKHYRAKGYNFRRVVVAGVNNFSIDFVKEITARKDYGYKFMGFFGEKDEKGRMETLDTVDNIYPYLIDKRIDEVYISMPDISQYHTKAIVKFCHLNFIKVHFLNEVIHKLSKRSVYVDVDYNGLTPVVSLAKEPLEVRMNRVMKRTFDLLFSLIFLVFIFSWLLPIMAVLIKLDSPGPVFFKQKRSGINYKPFYCYKFRTMRVNAESDTKQATKGDSRITPLGAFLRKTSIDEFPQFINVLIGNMSVVGPRPHMIEHTRMYSKLIKPFVIRHWVKPGITGLAQSKGFRGETKEVKQMQDRVKMDVFYIQHWSMFMDIRIIAETFWNMISMKKLGY